MSVFPKVANKYFNIFSFGNITPFSLGDIDVDLVVILTNSTWSMSHSVKF